MEQQREAVNLAVRLIRETALEAGQTGIPKSLVWLAFSEQGMPLPVFDQIVDGMAELGAITVRNNVIYPGSK